jgi:hypothetical protein
MLSSTPWGQPQTSREIAPGICFYSTARHGGYHLSPDRFETFRQFFPDYVLWAGDPWFEEDCDAALVTLTFAAEFSDQNVFFAEQSIRACVRRERTADTPWLRVWTTITHNETLAAVLQRADKFRLEHADDWQVGCAGTNDEGGWDVHLTRLRDGADRWRHFPDYPEKPFYSSAELFNSETASATSS